MSDKFIATIDADGVALAAIQGLHALVQDMDAEIAELRSEQTVMETQLADLTRRVEDQWDAR